VLTLVNCNRNVHRLGHGPGGQRAGSGLEIKLFKRALLGRVGPGQSIEARAVHTYELYPDFNQFSPLQ